MSAHVIAAAHYRENEEALAADPIIRDMAAGMEGVEPATYTHDDGSPRGRFMSAAGDRYIAQGGKLVQHIGGPANAVLRVLREWDEREPTLSYGRHRAAERNGVEPGTPAWEMLLVACRLYDEGEANA